MSQSAVIGSREQQHRRRRPATHAGPVVADNDLPAFSVYHGSLGSCGSVYGLS